MAGGSGASSGGELAATLAPLVDGELSSLVVEPDGGAVVLADADGESVSAGG